MKFPSVIASGEGMNSFLRVLARSALMLALGVVSVAPSGRAGVDDAVE